MALRKVSVAAVVSALVMGIALPAVAHGENDARALMRGVEVGPYTVTLWQVLGDHGSTLPPHLIISFEDEKPTAADKVEVIVDNSSRSASPSSSSPGSWETPNSVVGDQVVAVAIETENGQWASPAITVPKLLGSAIPMQILLALAVFFTTGAVYWLAGRTIRIVRFAMGLRLEKG